MCLSMILDDTELKKINFILRKNNLDINTVKTGWVINSIPPMVQMH